MDRRTSRSILSAVSCLAVLVAATGASSAPSGRRGPVPLGSVSGTVTAEGGGPLENICVDLYENSFGGYEDYVETDSSGRYSFEAVPPGEYVVAFYDFCDEEVNYADEWYDNAATYEDADPITVSPLDDVEGIDAALSTGGVVTGRVLDANTRQPLKDVCVNVFDPDGEGFSFAVTDGFGRYQAGGLRSGRYVIGFFHCEGEEPRYREEFYNNKSSPRDADRVAVNAPATTTGINASLVPTSGPTSKQVLLEATPRRTTSGRKVKLAARVLPCGGEPGDVVDFYRGNKLMDTKRTNNACVATTKIRVRRTAVFYAASPGDGDIQGGTSPLVKVRVRKRR